MPDYKLQTSENGLISLNYTFNVLLCRLMPLKGFTARKLASETGISVSTISAFKNNKRSIHTKTFELLINHLILQPDAEKI